MKALITGGTGFIGSNIVKKLMENNVDCTVFDNLSTGHFCNIEKYVNAGGG